MIAVARIGRIGRQAKFGSGLLGWMWVAVLGLALSALPLRAQLIITSSATAPTAGIQISQTVETGFNLGFTNTLGSGGSGVGQSFTPSANFDLEAITIRLGYGGANYLWEGKAVKFELYQLSSAADYTPDSTLLSATAVLPSTNPEIADGRYLSFAFTSVMLNAGMVYGWGVIPVDTESTGHSLPFRGATDAGFSGGRFLYYSHPAVENPPDWNTGPNSSADLTFYAIGTAAVPEPAATALLFGLLILAGVLSRRYFFSV